MVLVERYSTGWQCLLLRCSEALAPLARIVVGVLVTGASCGMPYAPDVASALHDGIATQLPGSQARVRGRSM